MASCTTAPPACPRVPGVSSHVLHVPLGSLVFCSWTGWLMLLFHHQIYRFLNWFHSRWFEPVDQPMFPPVLSRSAVIQHAALTEGVTLRDGRKQQQDGGWHELSASFSPVIALLYPLPSPSPLLHSAFGSSWEPTFQVPDQFILGVNALYRIWSWPGWSFDEFVWKVRKKSHETKPQN